MKTSELIGPALDWAVASLQKGKPLWVCSNNPPEHAIRLNSISESYSPSTNWAQGGPIIEREGVSIRLPRKGSRNIPTASFDTGTGHDIIMTGPTPLIAAMRCFVASKLGDVVHIPRELE